MNWLRSLNNVMPDVAGVVLSLAGVSLLFSSRTTKRMGTSKVMRPLVAAILCAIGVWSVISSHQRRADDEKNMMALTNKIESVQNAIGSLTQQLSQPVVQNDSSKQAATSRPIRRALRADPQAPPPAVPAQVSDAELTRRKQFLTALRGSYIADHDGVSPDLFAGLEWPPVEWLNAKLGEYKQTWHVAAGANKAELRIIDDAKN